MNVNIKRVLPFRSTKQDGMARRRANAKVESYDTDEINESVHQQRQKTENPALDETIEKKTIGLPAYVWSAIVADAKEQRRSIAKQLEVVLINHYQLGTYKIQNDVDKSPGSYGFVSYQKAS